MLQRHFTITTYILKDDRVLLIFHPKLLKWLPPGGHLENGETPPEGAKREVLEETGLEIAFISQDPLWIDCWNASSFERPFMCLLENIPPHQGLPAHQHMDLIYLARPVGGIEHAEELEKGRLKWFTLEEVENLATDETIFGETQQTIKHLMGLHV